MCEEFGKSPLEILEERAQLPEGFLEEVIEARAYAATKQMYDKPKPEESMWWQLVREIEAELVAEELSRES